MATSVACIPGWGVSDGELINAEQTRWSTLSAFDVAGGSSPLLRVPGILPTGGNALGVTQAGTPAMKVTVIAGSVVVPSNDASKPPYSMTHTLNTDLDIAAAHATNPRIDLVIAKVFDFGDSTSTFTIEILTGTAAASPARPTLPSGNNHCISLATVTVPAAASTIVNANIQKVESDTWTTATSDARYFTGPGGAIFKTGVASMSSTRRAAWSAGYAPGMPWWDFTNKVFGVTGSDAVPLSTRKLYEVVGAATVQTSSTTPVTVANSGTLTVFGGTRRIRVTASGKINCNGSADTRWMAARAYLSGSGSISGVPANDNQFHTRVWGAGTNPTTVSQQSFCISRVFDAGAGTFSVALGLLRVDAGGTGTGDTIQCVDGCLLVEDIGPA